MEPPEIFVETKSSRDYIDVSIRDKGIGIKNQVSTKYLINFIESLKVIFIM